MPRRLLSDTSGCAQLRKGANFYFYQEYRNERERDRIKEFISILRRDSLVRRRYPSSAISYWLQPAIGDGVGRFRRGQEFDQRVSRVGISGTYGDAGREHGDFLHFWW